MSPEEKAHDLIVRFYILPDEVPAVGNLKGIDSRQIAKQCAIICVEQIIEVAWWSSTGIMEDPYTISPKEYWKEVLEHIKNS